MYRYFTSLIKFIHKHDILPGDNINEAFFLLIFFETNFIFHADLAILELMFQTELNLHSEICLPLPTKCCD